MSGSRSTPASTPRTAEQRAHERARAAAVHPAGSFVPIPRDDVAAGPAEIVRRQAARTPGAVAIGGSSPVTFADLDAWSDRIVSTILEHAVPGNDRVALALHSGAAMIASVLAALKAGVTLVPIDPVSTPVDRAKLVFDDAGCVVTLSTEAGEDFARELHPSAPVAVLPDHPAPGPRCPAEPPFDPDGTAWIIYTSGSTGTPKGVAQSYRNVAHFIDIESAACGICRDDRVANLFSSNVNFWFRETLGALAKGASLWPVDLATAGFSGLARSLEENGITIVTMVPSLFRQFAPTLKHPPASVRVVKVGGEPSIRTDLDLFRTHFRRGCVLINRFGTTETAPVRYHFLDHDSRVTDAHIPIGYPVEGSEILLLDSAGAEVGVDTHGEIVVRSAHLATGYWNRPELTAATFRDDPGGTDARLYFTGDVGVARADGCVVHLGRKDNQVQVRGFRVELAEIEIRLREIDGVTAAAAAAFDDPESGTFLVGYIVPAGEPPAEETLREALGRSLPVYMIPTRWLYLEELPRAPNGKLYRKALPRPLAAAVEARPPDAAPSTPMEQRIAAHWAKVLRRDTPITAHATFLDLGGESLGAMQVIAWIEADTGVFVSPLDMGRQTLSQIARYCEMQQARPAKEDRGAWGRFRDWLGRLVKPDPRTPRR